MYAEFRKGGSSPEMWARNFLGSAALTRLRAKYFSPFLHDARWREIHARLAPGQSILDAGCGAGTWVDFLARQGHRAVGLDYSASLVASNREAMPEREWVQGSIQSMPLPDDGLDAIISWGVIEHDEAGPNAALREFYRVLRPGGWIFVTVPYDSTAARRTSEQLFGMRRDGREFFQYFMNEAELAEEVRRAGFEVERCFPCSRHYALVAPNLHARLEASPRLVRAVAGRALDLYTHFDDDTFSMILAVAQKV